MSHTKYLTSRTCQVNEAIDISITLAHLTHTPHPNSLTHLSSLTHSLTRTCQVNEAIAIPITLAHLTHTPQLTYDSLTHSPARSIIHSITHTHTSSAHSLTHSLTRLHTSAYLTHTPQLTRSHNLTSAQLTHTPHLTSPHSHTSTHSRARSIIHSFTHTHVSSG